MNSSFNIEHYYNKIMNTITTIVDDKFVETNES